MSKYIMSAVLSEDTGTDIHQCTEGVFLYLGLHQGVCTIRILEITQLASQGLFKIT